MFRLAKRPTPRLVLLLLVSAFLILSYFKARITPEGTPIPVSTETTPVRTAPCFSLSTNRTFSTSENPRLWLQHRNIDSLDFRVYHLNDPRRFFTQLSNPHQLGEDESDEVETTLPKPSLLEQIRKVKVWAYSGIKNYLRGHLTQNTRRIFNQTFRGTEGSKRVPLNIADYPRVPWLNSNQLVTSWREQLSRPENQYDQRVIPLGKQESGVYLVEAIGGELRAYTIVVVTKCNNREGRTHDSEVSFTR